MYRWIITRGYMDMGVSKNRGTPKSSILIGFSIINHPFWGTLNFGNTHIHHVCTFLCIASWHLSGIGTASRTVAECWALWSRTHATFTEQRWLRISWLLRISWGIAVFKGEDTGDESNGNKGQKMLINAVLARSYPRWCDIEWTWYPTSKFT